MIKLKVSTLTGGKRTTFDKIRECLQGYPEGLSPKLISAKTGINVNTVKSALPKMSDVRQIMRGLYKVYSDGHGSDGVVSLFDWNFHNLVLHAPSSLSTASARVFDFGLVRLDVRGVVCRCSSDWPLNVSSLGVVAGFFLEYINRYSSETTLLKDVMVSTIEFNHDFKNLRLDGAKSISVDNLVEQFKVYQKKRGLRVEHKTKVPIAVDTVVDMLTNQPDSVELHKKLNEQKEAIVRLIEVTRRNTDALLKIGGVKDEV